MIKMTLIIVTFISMSSLLTACKDNNPEFFNEYMRKYNSGGRLECKGMGLCEYK
jgi:hypothetical protein